MPFSFGKKTIFLSTTLFLGIFLYTYTVLAAQEAHIGASVSIINPLGPDLFITAIPERRVPNVSPDRISNKSTELLIKVFSANSNHDLPENLLYSATINTDDTGQYPDVLTLAGFSTGYYDFTAKGYAQLTRLLPNVLVGNFAPLDFSANGTRPLLSGDINLSFGDDKINALDMSILVNHWGDSDNRADLNQDTKVNSLDAGNILDHFNALGDK